MNTSRAGTFITCDKRPVIAISNDLGIEGSWVGIKDSVTTRPIRPMSLAACQVDNTILALVTNIAEWSFLNYSEINGERVRTDEVTERATDPESVTPGGEDVLLQEIDRKNIPVL